MESNVTNDSSLQADLLSSLEDPTLQMTQATTGQRFLNLFIDNIIMNYALSFLTGGIIGAVIGSVAPNFLNEAVLRENLWSYFILSMAIGYFNYIVYYTLCEKLFKGKTLGKLITGTRAVRLDGTELSFKDSILRTLCRMIPFEPFSAFGGHPWHDTLTKTMVIKSK